MKYFNSQIITTTLLKDQAVTTAKVADKAVTRAKVDDSLTPKWVQGGLMTHFRDDTTPGAGTAKGPAKNVSIVGTFDWVTPTPAGFSTSTNITMNAFGAIKFPATGTWTFYVTTDDGAELRVSQNPIFTGAYINQAPTVYSGNLVIAASGESLTRRILLNWYQGGSGSQLKLEWENAAAGYSRQVVPASALYYETPVWWPMHSVAGAGTIGVPVTTFQGTWLSYNYQYGPMWRVNDNHIELSGLVVPGAVGNVCLWDGNYANMSMMDQLFNQNSATAGAQAFTDMRMTGRVLTCAALPASTLWVNLQGIRWSAPFIDLG